MGSSSSVQLPLDLDQLEECLVRAHLLERREPGGGRWPYAGDAPWHLMLREREAGDYGGAGQDGVSDERPPRVPLSRAEVAELALLRAWLQMVPDAAGEGLPPEHDRKLVWLSTGQLAAGEGRVPWKAVGLWLSSPRSPDALVRRYRMALAAVLCRLHGWPTRRIRVLAA